MSRCKPAQEYFATNQNQNHLETLDCKSTVALNPGTWIKEKILEGWDVPVCVMCGRRTGAMTQMVPSSRIGPIHRA